MSVVGDAVLVEYDQSSTAAGTSGIGEEEIEETQSVGGDYDSNEWKKISKKVFIIFMIFAFFDLSDIVLKCSYVLQKFRILSFSPYNLVFIFCILVNIKYHPHRLQ